MYNAIRTHKLNFMTTRIRTRTQTKTYNKRNLIHNLTYYRKIVYNNFCNISLSFYFEKCTCKYSFIFKYKVYSPEIIFWALSWKFGFTQSDTDRKNQNSTRIRPVLQIHRVNLTRKETAGLIRCSKNELPILCNAAIQGDSKFLP